MNPKQGQYRLFRELWDRQAPGVLDAYADLEEHPSRTGNAAAFQAPEKLKDLIL